MLTDAEVRLGNVPRIRDVDAMLQIIAGLGASVTWIGENEVTLCARGLDMTSVDASLGEQIRASFLLAGPLLARFGRAEMPPPGGDFIGRRRLDPHLDAFEALGAVCEFDGAYVLHAERGLRAGDVLMDEPSVMARPRTCSWRRRSRRATDGDPQRRLQAARPGPRAAAGEDGSGDPGHQLEIC